MARSIEHEIKKCIICSKRKIYTGKTKEVFIPREEFGPLEQVVMDIAYFADENVKHKYLLVLIDRFSKLVSLIPMVRQDEKTLAQNILYHWIYKFGKPRSFLSDRGKVFEGKEMKMLANKFGIEQEFSSPYQHQSNGLAERTIRTVRDMLVTSKIGENSNKQWTSWIPKIEFYINATYQSSTGRSPFEIIYGRKLLLHGQFQDSKIDHSGNIAKAEFSNKKTADKLRLLDRSKRGERVFHVGEEVMVKIEPHKAKKNGFRYEGPYKILEFLSPHQVLIDFQGHPKPRRIDWLKKKQED
jgi:Integrase core domain